MGEEEGYPLTDRAEWVRGATLEHRQRLEVQV